MTWRDLPHEVDTITTVGNSLSSITRKLGTPPAADVSTMFSSWDEVVGEQMAAHAQPAGMKQQDLVVEVDDTRWATQLRWLAPQVIQRLNELIGREAIESMDIRVSSTKVLDRRGSGGK